MSIKVALFAILLAALSFSQVHADASDGEEAASFVDTTAKAATGCALAVGNNPARNFDACKAFTTTGNNQFAIYYTVTPDGSDADITFGIKVTNPSVGYIGWGLTATPGTMVGSDAAIITQCNSCPTGAKIDGYYLSSESNGANVAGSYKLKDASAARSADGTFVAIFTMPRSDSVDTLLAKPLNMIYTMGPIDAQGMPLDHTTGGFTYGSGDLDLTGSSSLTVEEDDGPTTEEKNTHAILMVTGWLLMVLGVVIAMSFKGSTSLWFQLHRAIQIIGLILVIAGIIQISTTLEETDETTHKAMGITATVLAGLQMVAFFRPPLGSEYRKYFNWGHGWSGRAAIALGIATIYQGMLDVYRVSNWSIIAFSVVLGVLVLVALGKFIYNKSDSDRRLRSYVTSYRRNADAEKGATKPDQPEVMANGQFKTAA